jgi:hypothetical protein
VGLKKNVLGSSGTQGPATGPGGYDTALGNTHGTHRRHVRRPTAPEALGGWSAHIPGAGWATGPSGSTRKMSHRTAPSGVVLGATPPIALATYWQTDAFWSLHLLPAYMHQPGSRAQVAHLPVHTQAEHGPPHLWSTRHSLCKAATCPRLSGVVVFFLHPPVVSLAPVGERNHDHGKVRDGFTCRSVWGVFHERIPKFQLSHVSQSAYAFGPRVVEVQ